MKSERVDTWVTSIPDRPGSLAAKLKELAAGDVNIEFIIARRSTAESGKTVVFVTPIKGPKQIGAAGAAGFTKTNGLHTLRIEGLDKPGEGVRILTALANGGLNLRGLSAAAIDKQFVCHIALDTEADAVKAARIVGEL
jgi:prephenate dehydratase